MYFEKLALEINATTAGWEVIKPERCVGTSGVEHRFTFLASDSGHMYGFDLYPEIGEIEVLRTFIKEMDTGVSGVLVCLSGKPSESAKNVAAELGVRICSPAEIGGFFKSEKMAPLSRRRTHEPILR
ncbi:MAG: hypothetical protein ABR867_01150 [Nitrososphaerales archaeon]|jgi:hypothetical protein